MFSSDEDVLDVPQKLLWLYEPCERYTKTKSVWLFVNVINIDFWSRCIYILVCLVHICVCVWWEGVADQVNPWEWKFPSQSLLTAAEKFQVRFKLISVKKFPVSFKWEPKSQFVDVTELPGRPFNRSWMKSPKISLWTDILGRSRGKLELLELFRARWSFICQLEGRRLFWPKFHTKHCKRIGADLSTQN